MEMGMGMGRRMAEMSCGALMSRSRGANTRWAGRVWTWGVLGGAVYELIRHCIAYEQDFLVFDGILRSAQHGLAGKWPSPLICEM